jgi:hypothetical protein
LTQRLTFLYALKEQHFFRKLETAEKIAIADMQLRSNISLQSCGYAVAEALPPVAELRLRKLKNMLVLNSTEKVIKGFSLCHSGKYVSITCSRTT